MTTTALANHLGITPSSVSAMLSRLLSLGLINHEPYADIRLTPAGLLLAMQVIRRRRLIELFLVEWLDYGADEVEDEADLLEHAASERFVDHLSAKLGDPCLDPHGDPIPRSDGRLPASLSHRLSTLQPGAAGTLVRIWNGDPEVVRYLESCGIKLGDRIEVIGLEPFGGPLLVHVGDPQGGKVHGFGAELAQALSIELLP